VVIGLTIVAMGTSAPELAVSISAGLSGSNEIAISNVIGSNIFNLMVVLGVCCILSPVAVDKGIMKRDFPFSIAIAVLAAVLIGENLIFGRKAVMPQTGKLVSGNLSRLDGIILIILFAVYIVFTVITALKNREEGEEIEEMSSLQCLIFIVCGAVAIVLGGQLVVNSAKAIALFFGMTETLVGLTVVALGTSLPELVTSIVASSKGQNGMAVGNVVGSNIFNILLILGVSSAIHPIPILAESVIDMVILIAFCLLVYIFCLTGKKLGKKEGFTMVILYVFYTMYAIARGMGYL
jgi:cation:H+ antiporter